MAPPGESCQRSWHWSVKLWFSNDFSSARRPLTKSTCCIAQSLPKPVRRLSTGTWACPTRWTGVTTCWCCTAIWWRGACAPLSDIQGHVPDEEQIAKIEPMLSNQGDVLRLLGSPSNVGTFESTTWY